MDELRVAHLFSERVSQVLWDVVNYDMYVRLYGPTMAQERDLSGGVARAVARLEKSKLRANLSHEDFGRSAVEGMLNGMAGRKA